jgi:hypothetical protein
MRCTLLLDIARIFLSRDSDLLAQERTDGVTIVFAGIPSAWVKPMKNLMNPIWLPIQAEGVNYFTFAAPKNLFRTFSERSNPRSPYYQAWVGGGCAGGKHCDRRMSYPQTLPRQRPALHA